jgi:nicotinate-nucleotide adenylyltransferase
MQRKLKKTLDEDRFEHTMGVRYTCAALAMRYSYDVEKAQVAGLLHDCAKCIPDKTKLKLCKKYKIEVSPAEKKSPYLLHAKLGAYLAKEEYDVKEEEILSAIACHTTGKAQMSLLDKILYIADYIEPNRNAAPDLDEIRQLAFQDLDETMYEILKGTLDYLKEKGKEIDPMTRIAYEAFHERRRHRGSK